MKIFVSFIAILFITMGIFFYRPSQNFGATVSQPVQGGTGASQIPLYGQVLVGTSAGIYIPSATSSLGLLSTSQKDWFVLNGALAPTTTIGILVNSSTTIGNGTQVGGLTISGGATTTGTAYFAGRIGVSKSAPAYPLDVAGFINTDQFSGYKLNGNTILYASTTNSSVVVGSTGAATRLSASSTLVYNLAVGAGALGAASLAGSFNTALGTSVLGSNTTGFSNVGLGYLALADNTTGFANMAIGQQSMWHNTTGSHNVSIGNAALRPNVSATSTVAIGDNSGVGNFTSYANQGGTFIGYQTGYMLQSGSNYNTLLGYQAGYDVTTGTNNTIIGSQQTTGNSITTGSNNILIGQGVRSGISRTGSNQLNIGNLIFGTSIGNNATLSTGNVGIATSTPWALLSIHAPAGTTPYFNIGSTTRTLYTIDGKGHHIYGGTTPTLSSCGTSPSITGNDSRGRIMVGTGVVTSCTLTFSQTYGTAPICSSNDESSVIVTSASSTPTTVVITSTGSVGGAFITYMCDGIY